MTRHSFQNDPSRCKDTKLIYIIQTLKVCAGLGMLLHYILIFFKDELFSPNFVEEPFRMKHVFCFLSAVLLNFSTFGSPILEMAMTVCTYMGIATMKRGLLDWTRKKMYGMMTLLLGILVMSISPLGMTDITHTMPFLTRYCTFYVNSCHEITAAQICMVICWVFIPLCYLFALISNVRIFTIVILSKKKVMGMSGMAQSKAQKQQMLKLGMAIAVSSCCFLLQIFLSVVAAYRILTGKPGDQTLFVTIPLPQLPRAITTLVIIIRKKASSILNKAKYR